MVIEGFHMSNNLTGDEKTALGLIEEQFEEHDFDFSKITIEKTSRAYIKLIAPNGINFCRISVNSYSRWLWLEGSSIPEKLKSDERLNQRNQRGSYDKKIDCSYVTEFKHNSDLIIECYKKCIGYDEMLSDFENAKKLIHEELETLSYEQVIRVRRLINRLKK